MAKKKTTYRLFALPLSQDAVDAAQRERFSRVSAGYALIYTAGTVKNAVEIKESQTGLLTKAESEWLTDCNTIIIVEEAKKNEKKILESLNHRMTALEAALAEERRKENAEHGNT